MKKEAVITHITIYLMNITADYKIASARNGTDLQLIEDMRWETSLL